MFNAINTSGTGATESSNETLGSVPKQVLASDVGGLADPRLGSGLRVLGEIDTGPSSALETLALGMLDDA